MPLSHATKSSGFAHFNSQMIANSIAQPQFYGQSQKLHLQIMEYLISDVSLKVYFATNPFETYNDILGLALVLDMTFSS